MAGPYFATSQEILAKVLDEDYSLRLGPDGWELVPPVRKYGPAHRRGADGRSVHALLRKGSFERTRLGAQPTAAQLACWRSGF